MLQPHLPNCQLATVSDDGWFLIKAHIYPTPRDTFFFFNHKMYTQGWGHRNRCDNNYKDLEIEGKETISQEEKSAEMLCNSSGVEQK